MTGRIAATVLALAVLTGYGWFAIQAYRYQRDPERFADAGGPLAAAVGPPADGLSADARSHLELGLDVLNDARRPAAERLEKYREHLTAAEALLLPSLATRPTQARALSQLAVIRWELDPPLSEEELSRHLTLIEQAASMAPNRAPVMMDLGELLLRMGRTADGLAYIRRAVELRPDYAGKIVTLLDNLGYDPVAMLEALPGDAAVLEALHRPFFDQGREAEYLEALEPFLDDPSVALLGLYGVAHRRAGTHEPMLERLGEIGPFDRPALEAARLRQRSRALTSLGRLDQALEEAGRAAELLPGHVGVQENLGQVALAADRGQLALEAFSRAMETAAEESAEPALRARLYAEIGQSEEALRRMDRAYDAYRRALELDPSQPLALRRSREMEQAAGTR